MEILCEAFSRVHTVHPNLSVSSVSAELMKTAGNRFALNKADAEESAATGLRKDMAIYGGFAPIIARGEFTTSGEL